MNELRCGNCGYWVGESREPMMFVEIVKRAEHTRVTHPRDLRVCKSCGNVCVFLARGDLDKIMGRAVG